MSSSAPAHLATTHRGDAREAVIRGHVAVVDAVGAVLGAVGDPAAPTTLRSCVKPLQALPFVRLAVEPTGATTAEIAVACASHNGEPTHVETVSALLARVGLDADALSCGPQLPYDEESAQQALVSGAGALRITNNCSGKHAAMLAACVVAGLPTSGYGMLEHPLQKEIRAIMSGYGGLDLDGQPYGIDGCGLPTHEVPLTFLARAFAAASSDPAFRRCQAAMAAHPHLVAGRNRFDTAALAAAGDRVTVKGGGAAVWAAVLRPGGPGLAIKLEAGEASAMPAVALAAMRTLGWLDEPTASGAELAPYARHELRNWAGTLVGSTDVEAGWQVDLVG